MSILKSVCEEDEEETFTRSSIQRASSASWRKATLEVMGFRFQAWLFEIWSALGRNACIFHEIELCIIGAVFYGRLLDEYTLTNYSSWFSWPCAVSFLTVS